MSYLNILTEADREILTTINQHLYKVLETAKIGFINKHPGMEISDAELKFENTIFSGNCLISGVTESFIEFKNCYFLNDVVFIGSKFNKRISFNHCFFDREVRIHRNNEFDQFDFIVASIKGQLYIDGGKFQESKWSIIDNCRVVINGGTFSNLMIGYWGGATLCELSFHFPNIQGLIKIIGEKTKIERLDLFQFSSDVSVSVEDISVNSLSIYRYRNEKALRFSNLKIYKTNQISEFSIVESYLGKTEFYSIDFGAFDSVKILDSHLVDCVFVNTKWPTKIDALKGRYISMSDKETAFPIKLERLEKRLYENINEKNLLENDPEIITYYEKKREVLRQLKFSLGKQGDIINEQKFHSLEMVTYDKTLTWDNNFWTKSIIKFSYYFSDFGQSISQPLIGLLAIHFMFFAILVLCRVFPNFQFSIENPDATGFWNGFYEYFRLINPFRKADDTFKGGFISIDLLMRIWSSYMIYNIIRASRRFLK